mgnify:CR=1 FL=1
MQLCLSLVVANQRQLVLLAADEPRVAAAAPELGALLDADLDHVSGEVLPVVCVCAL